jgi:hypothetical protein
LAPSSGRWKGIPADPRQIFEAENEGTDAERNALADSVVNTRSARMVSGFIGTFVPPSAREAGLRNDLQQIRTATELPLEQIVAPTLIMRNS